MTTKPPEVPEVSGLRFDDFEMPTAEEWNARETKFRIGAHHAVTRLAEALEEMTNVKDCRRLADVFADVIGRARISKDDFDLNSLIYEAKRQVKDKR